MSEEEQGSIHIRFDWVEQTENPFPDAKVAHLLLHEASHKFAGTHDYSYSFKNDYPEKYGNSEARANADSYACAISSAT